ncbi:hypothetical protein [Tateyamaria sp.]|uniref:hypothetical protein n=1 Tax=Tateyamaria sp. TaxID=1929288 RepID=UPI00329B0667
MKFCSLALLCAVSAQAAFAENTAVVGTFDGIIWSSGDTPGATRFVLTSDDKIIGAYSYDSFGETAEGHLEECALTAQILRCIWNDEWGSGDFAVAFASDFSSFSGKWFDDIGSGNRSPTDAEGHVWTGKKR